MNELVARDPTRVLPRRKANVFRPDIQGLRAVAVLLVVLYHANLPFLSGGFVGVDVFFVISGFLITGHILKDLTQNRFSFATFYARRVRRILPASFVVLALTLVIAWLVLPPLQLTRITRDAMWTAIYLPNVLFAREGLNYLASPQPSLFQHYWSLGIEEQFYLVWPFVLWAVYRLTRRNVTAVVWTVAALSVASFVGSILLTATNQPYAFFLLPTRAWELGIGGLVALILAKRPPQWNTSVRVSIGLVGLTSVLAAAVLYSSATAFPSYWAAAPVIGTALVILAGPYDGLVAGLLQNPVALFVGAISYSVYLVHWPLLVIPEAASSWMQPLELWQSLTLGALAIPLGWLSYRFVETPFRNGKATNTFRSTVLPLVAAVMCAVILAGLSMIGIRHLRTQSIDAGKPAPEFVLTTTPVSAPFVGSNLSARLQDAQKERAVPSGKGCHLTTRPVGPPPGCTYGRNEDAPTVTLVGDSHAAQWAPGLEALAESGEIYLTTHTRDSCSLQPRVVDGRSLDTLLCEKWREEVIELLNETPPDVILLTHSIWSRRSITAQNYYDAMAALLPQLPKASKVVLVADTPFFPGDPMSCLSANLHSPERCSVPQAHPRKDAYASEDAKLAKVFGGYVIDFTQYLCNGTCPLVQGNMLVFKDTNHLSKTFSKRAAPAILEALALILAEPRKDR